MGQGGVGEEDGGGSLFGRIQISGEWLAAPLMKIKVKETLTYLKIYVWFF